MKTKAACIRYVMVFLHLPLLISTLGRMIGKVANLALGPGPTIVDGALDFLSVLQAVSKGYNLTQQAYDLSASG